MNSFRAIVGLLGPRPVVLVGIVVGIVYTPLLAVYFRDLWLREHYRFARIFFVVVLMLGWKRWRDAPAVYRALPLPSLVVLFGTAFISLALASFLRSPALAFISVILAAAGGLMVATRRRAMCHAPCAWGLVLAVAWLSVAFSVRSPTYRVASNAHNRDY